MEFNAKKVKDDIIRWIRDWFSKNGRDCNAIIGISGGKDSSVAAALCAEALGKQRVIGLLMPNGQQSDIDVARRVVSFLDIKHYEVNIKNAYDGLIGELEGCLEKIERNTIVNLPPRLRMAALYAVAQSSNGRVVNTCNLSEDYVGYSTRYGDSAGDFSPLANLTVGEVRLIGRCLGLPAEFVEKIPSDGLSGLSDEDNLGFTYDVLDKYIRTGVCEDSDIKAKIDRLHKMNLFKLQLMPSFPYGNE